MKRFIFWLICLIGMIIAMCFGWVFDFWSYMVGVLFATAHVYLGVTDEQRS